MRRCRVGPIIGICSLRNAAEAGCIAAEKIGAIFEVFWLYLIFRAGIEVFVYVIEHREKWEQE
jgi:hypothetical protein